MIDMHSKLYQQGEKCKIESEPDREITRRSRKTKRRRERIRKDEQKKREKEREDRILRDLANCIDKVKKRRERQEGAEE